MSVLSIAHVNLTVPAGTLAQANEFYGTTLGLTPRPVPHLQRDSLAWFDIGDSGQQVHIAFGDVKELEDNLPKGETGEDKAWTGTRRHPCFKVGSGEELLKLRKRIHDHYVAGGPGAPSAADAPGQEDSGAKGIEYPQRFFARDYAGNRLEFSL
ncbi:hypothetical protein PV10_06635 [Exophiala mesophila]|uniref:VOC domain-containing protein n=1 Tax=Exophiala mesophila TaxID=212818 RepID=A0A0D1WSL2_EXOME|nr:uncharacterized protein PV10_06635 [Exophiala mesophila]KIV92175.1 hypothetical protein PV10_06635 [Exophiala mesophila]